MIATKMTGPYACVSSNARMFQGVACVSFVAAAVGSLQSVTASALHSLSEHEL